MADWSPLRQRLASVDHRLTIDWSDLDHLVGGLPRSAYDHAAFWKGARSGWPGFTTTDVRVGEAVTFLRRGDRQETPRPRRGFEERAPLGASEVADVVLVGCVKSKLDGPAPARDLYTSALFRKERAYAEAVGVPWYVLSAEHGLVEPAQEIEPYELHLASTTRAYRATWEARVVEDLASNLGDLSGKHVEVQAGADHANAIRGGLRAAGATVVKPLAGLIMGRAPRLVRPGRFRRGARGAGRPAR